MQSTSKALLPFIFDSKPLQVPPSMVNEKKKNMSSMPSPKLCLGSGDF